VPHLFAEVDHQVRHLRQTHGLFGIKDQLNPGGLLPATVGEAEELQEALDANDTREASGELMDVLNYYFSFLIITNQVPEAPMSAVMQGVNGYGQGSAAIERVAEVILDSQDDPRAIAETLRRTYSIGLYLPVPFVSIDQFNKMIIKVAANRPVEFYSGLDPLTGKPLEGDDASLAFAHFEKSLRMIRNSVGRTLKRADWFPHQALIGDWRHSAANQAALQIALLSPLGSSQNATPQLT